MLEPEVGGVGCLSSIQSSVDSLAANRRRKQSKPRQLASNKVDDDAVDAAADLSLSEGLHCVHCLRRCIVS